MYKCMLWFIKVFALSSLLCVLSACNKTITYIVVSNNLCVPPIHIKLHRMYMYMNHALKYVLTVTLYLHFRN
jgi:uncharacterized protein YcgI (DUF1989 family)